MVNDLFQPMHLLIIFLFMIPLVVAAFLVPLWVAFKKAGLSPAFSLLIFVPFGPIIVLYILAFSNWKVVPAAPEYPPYPTYPPPQPGYVPPTAYAAPPAYPPQQPTYVPPTDTNPGA